MRIRRGRGLGLRRRIRRRGLPAANASVSTAIASASYVDPDVARDALRRRSMFNVIEIAIGAG
jgi:hypothetical protein